MYHDKKNSLSLKKQFGTFTLSVSVSDEKGNPLDSEKLACLYQPGFPILFAQNKLLKALSEEIFEQQLTWREVQKKRLKDCNKTEREIKQLPHPPLCSEIACRILDKFEIRSERSPQRAITYATTLAKIESMVKDQWDEWRLNHPETSV